MLAKLCSIHYRIILYGSLLLEEVNMWTNHHTKLSIHNQEKLDFVFQHLETFIFNDPIYVWLSRYKPFLYRQYAQLFDQHLLSIKPPPVVNIGLYSKFSTTGLKNYLNSIFSQHLQINFTDSSSKQTDVVISEIILSKEVLENLGIACKIIYIQIPISEIAYQELKNTLTHISKEKMSIHN
ncbi:MAG: hypothetical protein IC227_02760 [Enterococcus lacertideformus]|uniref:Mga helix-turn-helix domain-containing protein n=1 Tax=Enterococcus lacertideformus TaxID=2771493 RepID=A0A931AZ57_9ENTE|nr:hypothetical protein [Enterococcus lacertideformus]